MSSFRFIKSSGIVQGREQLFTNLKRLFLSLPDGEYVWPHPTKHREKRSVQQNRYYHGVVCKLISDTTGFTPEEIHQILAEKFLSYEKKGRKFTESTTKLNTIEFEGYMEDCRRFAAVELQCYIPLPNEPNNYFYDLPKKVA